MSGNPVSVCDTDRMQHDALYEEIHKVDDLLETHANIMIVLVSGLLVFLFTLRSMVAIDVVSFLGFLVSLEFFLHTYRFKHIAKSAVDRLSILEEKLGIDTRRKPTYLLKLKVPTGSTLLCCIALMFVALWLILIALFNAGLISI